MSELVRVGRGQRRVGRKEEVARRKPCRALPKAPKPLAFCSPLPVFLVSSSFRSWPWPDVVGAAAARAGAVGASSSAAAARPATSPDAELWRGWIGWDGMGGVGQGGIEARGCVLVAGRGREADRRSTGGQGRARDCEAHAPVPCRCRPARPPPCRHDGGVQIHQHHSPTLQCAALCPPTRPKGRASITPARVPALPPPPAAPRGAPPPPPHPAASCLHSHLSTLPAASPTAQPQNAGHTRLDACCLGRAATATVRAGRPAAAWATGRATVQLTRADAMVGVGLGGVGGRAEV